MSRWPWLPNPAPASTLSSLITRSALNPMCLGSWYSPNENVCRLSSQPQFVRPRSSAGRTWIMAVSPFGSPQRDYVTILLQLEHLDGIERGRALRGQVAGEARGHEERER